MLIWMINRAVFDADQTIGCSRDYFVVFKAQCRGRPKFCAAYRGARHSAKRADARTIVEKEAHQPSKKGC
jgi:hypothetical protein